MLLILFSKGYLSLVMGKYPLNSTCLLYPSAL